MAPAITTPASANVRAGNTSPMMSTGISPILKPAATAWADISWSKTKSSEFWWYGTGSYVNPFPQEGFMFHNRYGAGLLFWKSGAKAQASWTFCRPPSIVS